MPDDTNGLTYMMRRQGVNLDITHRCPLECPRCQRFSSFTEKGLKVPGSDMPFEEFEKVTERFKHINLCGQVSDPVHHPKFIEFLEHTHSFYLRNQVDVEVRPRSVSVHHASGGKPLRWYPKAFKANPRAKWWIGLDGLPKDSPKYRINQDGDKMIEILKLGKKYLEDPPIWQMIVFKFNENDIDTCRDMASDLGVDFAVISSSRWLSNGDPLKPSSEYALRL